jgi:hypothetical protein
LSAFLLQFDEFPGPLPLGLPWQFFRAVFWVGIVFFGVGIPASVAVLAGGMSLTLDRTGFESVKFFGPRRVRWEDVSDFKTCRPGFFWSAVVFDNAHKTSSLKARLDSWLSGRNDYLPDTYGLPAHDLAALMNQWRELALK